MPYVFMVFWSQGKECNKRENTHTRKQRLTKHTPAVERSPVPPFLPHSLSVPQNAYLPTFCSMWNMDRLTWTCPLSYHIWRWSEGLLEVEASGPINNHTAELRVRQQSADEPVSTKHIVPSPFSFLMRTTLTFTNVTAEAMDLNIQFHALNRSIQRLFKLRQHKLFTNNYTTIKMWGLFWSLLKPKMKVAHLLK